MIDRRQAFRSLVALPAAAWAAFSHLTPRLGASSAALAQDAPGDGESYWNHLRWQFLVPSDQAFFNTGTLGASPRVVLDAVTEHLRYVEETVAEWDYSADQPEWLAGYRPEKRLRQKLADYIHCDMDEVGLTINATMAMNMVANGIDLAAGDEVLITDKEHPGGRSGWDVRQKRHGVVVKEVAIGMPPKDPDEIVSKFEAAITPKTKVLAVPHITSGQGIILPVKRLSAMAKARNIFTVIDGAQAVGQLHVNVTDLGADAYFSSPHKFLLAPKGNGLLYVRRDAQARIWATLASSQWNNYKDGMFRLQQYGTVNQSLIRGLEAAVDFMDRIGRDRIEARVRALGGYLRGELAKIPKAVIVTPLHPELAAAITTWGIQGIPGRRLQDELWSRKKIRVRANGTDWVRQSCHIYNTMKELDATLEVARSL